MHDIMPPVGAGAQLIQSYGATGFRIGNVQYDTAVLVTPTATIAWSGALTLDALEPILADHPEVLLIGTGTQHRMLPPELRQALKNRAIATDTMNTGAACRTFNILLGESRRVAAAVMLPTA